MKKNALIVMAAVCFFICAPLMSFNSFTDFTNFVTYYHQDPTCNNNDCDWMDPNFSDFYKTKDRSFLWKITNALGITHIPFWNAHAFKELLQQVTDERKKNPVPISQQIELVNGQRCIIWGDLQGAVQSFQRCLRELIIKGILEEDLSINGTTYFVILGDAINRSAFSIEMLQIIATLMFRNPGKVIYLRGKHEYDRYWENFNLRRELMVRALSLRQPEDQEVPLSSVINEFFETLPRSLIIKATDKTDQVIYCAHEELPLSVLKERENIMVDIMGESRLRVPHASRGLQYLGFTYGTAQWSIMSCPSKIYQDFFQFYYDTFVVLEMSESIKTSTLTLYSQDVRKLDGFETHVYDILFGKLLEKKADVNKIHNMKPFDFGSTMPLTGMASDQGIRVKKGIDAVVHHMNQRGGLHGQLIRPFVLDDQYVPWMAEENTDTLVKKGIDISLLPYGTPTLMPYLDRVKRGEILVVFPFTGAPQIRRPDIKYIIHYRPAFEDEVQCLVQFMIKEFEAKDFAFVYQDDDFGRPSLNVAHAELRKNGIQKWLDIPYSREQVDFAKQVEELRVANPEAIGFFSVPTPARKIIASLGSDFFLGKHLFGIMDLGNLAFRKFLKDAGIAFTLSMVVPDPETSNLDIVVEYRNLMDSLGQTYESDSLEAYITTALFLHVLDRIKPPYTKERILKTFESFDHYPFKGLDLKFNPKKRDLGQPIWILTEDGTITKCERS